MAYFSIEFNTEKPRFDTEEVFNNHPLLSHIFKAWQECNGISLNNKNYIIQLYDLFVFWLDIELFRNFVQVLKRSDIDFKFEIEEHGCITHYGKILGNKLLKVIRAVFDTLPQPSLDLYSKIKYDIDPYNISSNIATLLSIKAACLEQYSSKSESMSFERIGLTFSGIKKRLNLDPFSTSICIDLLCDNAALKPFDRVEEDLRVARFYNTDIEDFIGIFTRLFSRAEYEGITIGRTNLGKFTTFINYFAISIDDKSKNPIKVKDAPQGKVIQVICDEKDIDYRLEDLFTNYHQYRDVFSYKGGQYNVKAKTPRGRLLEHLDIIESETKLDSYLDIIFEIYKKLENYLDEHPEIVDSGGDRRNIYDVFPGFIELLGEGYPEGGLKIVGSLTKRSFSYYERYLKGDSLREGKDPKEEADRLLLHAIPHKIAMYQKFSEIYLECYKHLSNPYIFTRRDVWKSMCVYPSNSLILELCNKIVFYMQEEIKNILDIENKSLQNQKLQNLEKKVMKFLDLMTKCSIKPSNDSSKVQYLPNGTSEKLYIVSVDLKDSTKISALGDPRWEPIVSYLINIMCRWAETYDGKLINLPGDEIIVAFQELTSARSFAAGCCIQLTEISESINQCETFERYTTGCYGRITHGLVKVDENGDCISKELNIMCKSLPKKEGKIVIDAETVGVCVDFSGTEFVDGERSYCKIDSKEEFKRMILSQFE